jgi:hypothetical protein
MAYFVETGGKPLAKIPKVMAPTADMVGYTKPYDGFGDVRTSPVVPVLVVAAIGFFLYMSWKDKKEHKAHVSAWREQHQRSIRAGYWGKR